MEFKSDPSLTRPSNLGWISNLTNTDPAMCRVLLLELALETAKVSLFAADSTTATEMVRAPDGYPKRTGTGRHLGRQFSSTAKLIASLHAQKGDQRQRDQKMLRRTDKGVTFLFVGLFVGSFAIFGLFS